MRFLEGDKEEEAINFMQQAAQVAREATCERARCGTVIVSGGKIIGRGFNSPPGKDRRCKTEKSSYDSRVTDKTCCIHAEQRAIMDALKKYPDMLPGSTLFFMRIDQDGNMTRAGEPYCTICSKMALDTGIAEFVLWQEKGIAVFDTVEYNRLSFDFKN